MEEKIKELRARRDSLFARIRELEKSIEGFEDEIRLGRLKEYLKHLGLQLRKYFSKNFKARSAIIVLEPEDVNLWSAYKRQLSASLSIERAAFSREAQAIQNTAELKKFLRARLVSLPLEGEEEKRELTQIVEGSQ